MKTNIRQWGIIVLLAILNSGCTSIRARTEAPDKKWGVYPGVRKDVNEMSGIFNGQRPKSGWQNGMVATILTLDLPFSALFDTVAAPYDLYHSQGASGEAGESPK